MISKKILLIVFKFPPYAGVGAKRWAKFGKYLAKDGYKVHVVTVRWKKYGPNTWVKDIQHPNIIVHKIPSLSFHNIKYKPFSHSLAGIFLHRLRQLFFRFLSLLYYVDEAQFWGWSMVPFCEKLIRKEKIINVIATGAPFMANYWAARLKVTLPEINLIQDFRDPWNDNPLYPFLLPKFKEKSNSLESYSLQHCDCLMTVTHGLLDFLKKKLGKKKSLVVYNGFDSEYSSNIKRNIKRFTIIYIGNLGCGRSEVLDNFLRVVLDHCVEFPEIQLIFYGHFPGDLKNKYTYLINKGILLINNYISPADIRKKIQSSFLGLQINSAVFPYLMSSKIFEYVSLKSPVLSINGGGEIDKLIKDNKFGDSINYKDKQGILLALKKWYSIWKKNPNFKLNVDTIKKFSYKELIKKIKKILL